MENQNTEYKESWRDEYIKWICGFANASGGKMYIGIDDKGNITGISDVKKLAEDLPNKVKDILGLLVDVNIKKDSDKEYLEIITDAYPYPVNYKGKYYYRTGATNQELKGAVLDKFLLGKQGLKWDGTPEPYTSETDLSDLAFKLFKDRATETQRFNEDVQDDSPRELLEKLNLFAVGGYLKKASILLFHPKPEKIFTGATLKIGFFKTDDDLAYQDEVRGSLFEQVDKVMGLLITKYLKAQITYKGVQRKETFPVPVGALREAVLNAIVHKDYSSGIPVQISVYEDKLIIWNEGELPENWTVAKLKMKHPSRPYNPDIANAFFRSGLIESWGRGTIKIFNEAKVAKTPVPIFRYEDNGFYVIFNFVEVKVEQQVLDLIKDDSKITIAQMGEGLDIPVRTMNRILNDLKDKKIIKRSGSKKEGFWEIL